MKVALLFPGQGAQYVGMGQDLARAEPLVAATLAEADQALGFPLSQVVRDGPEDRLAETPITQPAVLALSVAMWRLLQARLPHLEPAVAAGHSLGEYAALVAAGALEFQDALKVVHARGRAMQEAVPVGVGAMAAILGSSPSAIRALCEDVVRDVGQPRVLEIAGFNCPGQVVVAGHRDVVEEAVRRAAALGGPEPRFLHVSAPFHTSLLEPARIRMDQVLAGIPIQRPRFPVLQNVDALPHMDPEEIRANLVSQVVRPVLWEATAIRLVEMGVDAYVELGPGRTLASLLKRVHRKALVLCMDRTDAWSQILEQPWT